MANSLKMVKDKESYGHGLKRYKYYCYPSGVRIMYIGLPSIKA
jgi:hypothetical protein